LLLSGSSYSSANSPKRPNLTAELLLPSKHLERKSAIMSQCFQGPAAQRKGRFQPFIRSGKQVLYKIRKYLDYLSDPDHVDGLHPDLETWFDELLVLPEENLLGYNILYKRELHSNCKVHSAVEEWLKENFENLKIKVNKCRTLKK